MSEYYPFIVLGIVTGSIYGICAMGLVLTYKTSGVFNIGHGAVCAAGAYEFYWLSEDMNIPRWVAAAIAIVVFGPITGLILERLAVALSGVAIAYKIVGTVGLLVAIRALINIAYTDTVLFDPLLPQDTAFTVAEVSVSYDSLITFGIGVTAAVALFLFFRLSRIGTAMRGVVDDPQLLSMSGTAPTQVRRVAWVIGSSFAALSGLLFASNQGQLDVNVLTLLVVQAFGAATIGRFQSLPLTFIGGLAVGVLQKVVSQATGSTAELQGIDLAVPFLVLFVGLLVIPKGKLPDIGQVIRARAVPPSPFSSRQRTLGYMALAAVLLVVPNLAGSRLPVYNIAMTQVLLFLSLHLLVRTSGQISLAQVGFAAVGAAGFGHMLGHGVPFFLALLIGGLICLPVALVVSVPAIRLSGLYLALATLGLGITLAQYAYDKPYMFGSQLLTRRPGGFEDDKSYYYLLLAIAGIGLAVVLVVEHTRLGRLLRAMSDSPLALTSLGASVNVARVLVFCLAGFLAGISGGLYSSLFGAATQDTFNYVLSLLALAVLTIAGRRTITVAFVAPFLLYVLPAYIDNVKLDQALQLAFGLGAILAAAASQGGLSTWLAKSAEKNVGRLRGPTSKRIKRAAVASRASAAPRHASPTPPEMALASTGATTRHTTEAPE
jgi:ABC-type branched-subunit amino acid transport system permease subunit